MDLESAINVYTYTITLFRQTLRYTPNCTTYSFPRLPSNGLATIALFLCHKFRFLEFSEGKIV